MTKTVIAMAVAAAVVITLLIFTFATIGNYNDYTRIENLAKAAQKNNENVLDNTRKSIREAANISDKEVEALTNIITGYAEARGGNTAGSGQLVTVGMVTEAVPGISGVKTLQNLQNILVAGRTDWKNAQKDLLEIKRQADNLIQVFPVGTILKMLGKKEIEVVIVTSKETSQNFESGEDNTEWVK